MCLKEFLKNIADEIRAKKSEALGETIKDEINPQDFSIEIFGISLPYLSRVMVDMHGKGKNFVTNITIDDNLTEIKKSAFTSLTNIINITIPSSVTSIGESAFKGCTSLDTVNISIDSNLSTIGAHAFDGCNKLKSFYIPDGVTTIKTNTFSGTSLDSIDLNQVKVVNQYSFSGTPMASVTIPKSVSSITPPVFGTVLREITVDEENEVYDSRDNCNAIIKRGDNTLILACKETQIPSSVTALGSYSYSQCSILEIIIPSNIITIKSNCFSNNGIIKSIVFDEQSEVKTLSTGVFTNCTVLEKIVFPPNIEGIKEDFFFNNNALKLLDFSNFSEEEPPVLNSANAFSRLHKDFIIVVPNGKSEKWKEATNWSNYESKIKTVDEYNAELG